MSLTTVSSCFMTLLKTKSLVWLLKKWKENMKVRTIQRFEDYKEEVIREIGDVFVVNKNRFKEIDDKLPGFIEEVSDDV
ncbi:conserved hypothetical protein [Streptococcus agalactiae 515]|nr:conserved hypothetical protein [Streptococcus agalactiae 515]